MYLDPVAVRPHLTLLRERLVVRRFVTGLSFLSARPEVEGHVGKRLGDDHLSLAVEVGVSYRCGATSTVKKRKGKRKKRTIIVPGFQRHAESDGSELSVVDWERLGGADEETANLEGRKRLAFEGKMRAK
jgi:hypothetical protein